MNAVVETTTDIFGDVVVVVGFDRSIFCCVVGFFLQGMPMLHWDAMMAELLWMQNDFINERKYKVKKAKDLGRGVLQTLRKKGACWPVWLWLWLWWHSTDLWFKTLLLLCVHCLCIVCAWSVHCLCIVCALSVHCLCIVCALCVCVQSGSSNG
jgi:hypothetical protein